MAAAPQAVDSNILGRNTGTFKISAWNCINISFWLAPPSTRSSFSGWSKSDCIAVSTSDTWNAMDSKAARAICALLVPRDIPHKSARASLSQCGAPSPVNAGTSTTPSLEVTLLASCSTSLLFWIIPKPSRSHCTTAPAIKTLPSRAKWVWFWHCHAKVVSNLFWLNCTWLPVLNNIKQPVP